jgi:hypothetical protein
MPGMRWSAIEQRDLLAARAQLAQRVERLGPEVARRIR